MAIVRDVPNFRIFTVLVYLRHMPAARAQMSPHTYKPRKTMPNSAIYLETSVYMPDQTTYLHMLKQACAFSIFSKFIFQTA